MKTRTKKFLLLTTLTIATLGLILSSTGCSISPSPVSQVIYVSKDGDDYNDGLSPSTPVYTITKAIEIANTIDPSQTIEIKITIGGYFPGDGLNNNRNGLLISRPNITISGGWDNSFKFSIGKTELDGDGYLYHIIKIENTTNIAINNLIIKGGLAYDTNSSNFDDTVGGGIFIKNSSYIKIEESVEICSNSAFGGGGICLFNSQNNLINCSVYDNRIFGLGGGIFLTNSHNNTISGKIHNNVALAGGGFYFAGATKNKVEAQVFSNIASMQGGGGQIEKSQNTLLNGSIYNNSAKYGGGLYLKLSDYFTNNGWITNNLATNSGGGIYTNEAHPNSYFGNVGNNKLTNGTINNFN